MRRSLFPLAAGAVLAFAGWFAGRHLANKQVHLTRAPSEFAAAQTMHERDSENSSGDRPSRRTALSFDEEAWKKAGAEWARESSPARRQNHLFEMASRLTTADFPAAMQAFVEEGVGPGELLEVFAERDLSAARAWFDTRPLPERARLLDNLSRT